MRHIILHNHLFKNAGTSVDHILRQNFDDRWVSAEFQSIGEANTAEVTAWIKSTPRGIAFSSHTLRGPLPQMEGINIIPVTLLRDPVDRIASAYRFERAQTADTLGTHLARKHGFAGYVHARLSEAGDRQCRNFQTQRLADLVPLDGRCELVRARSAAIDIAQAGMLGLVSEFEETMDRLRKVLIPHYPTFRWQPVTANASCPKSGNTVSPDMREILIETNEDDLTLLDYARGLFAQASTEASTSHDAGIV